MENQIEEKFSIEEAKYCMEVMHKENKKGLKSFEKLIKKIENNPDKKRILIDAKFDYLQNLPPNIWYPCRLIFNNEYNLLFCTLIDMELHRINTNYYKFKRENDQKIRELLESNSALPPDSNA